MGQEIFYCSKCQTQLRSADFEKGRAVRIDGVAWCTGCAPERPKPEEPVRRSGTENLPHVHAPPRRTSGPPKAKPLLFACLAGGALLVVGLVAVSVPGGKSAPPPPPRPVASPPEPPPVALPPVPAPRRLEASREALRKARDFAQARPGDWAGQLALYEQAAREARDTDLADVVLGERDGILKRQRDALAAEAASIEERVRPLIEREQFGAAIAAWREARGAHAGPDWTGLCEQRATQVRVRAEGLLTSLKAREPATPELRARVAAWGLPELEKGLADVAPPKPVASPEADAFRTRWRTAMAAAAARDYAAAVEELERARPELATPALQAELAADLELVKSLGAFHAEALQGLAKWPATKALKAEYVDEDGRLKRIEGLLVKSDAGVIELREGIRSVAVPVGELAPGTFGELQPPGRMLGLMRAVEGEATPDPTIPPKYLAWAAPAPEPSERERQARRLFYAAERELLYPATRALGALKARSLLEDFKDTAFVRRNRTALAARTELGKDHVLFSDDLEATGTFRRAATKTGPIWSSDADTDPAQQKLNFVEAEYSVLPGTTYRAWAYVGGCCAETLGFVVQGSDLAEPGGDTWVPVKQSVAVTRTHAGHGGRKQPSRWGWVELPATEHRAPGTKSLRLLTHQQGFAVAAVVVSATRKAPPAEAELRKARAARPSDVPSSGLALWLRADEGVVLSDGAVSEWKDQSGRQRNAAQAEAGRRPLLAPGAVNGKPALVFDGRQKTLEVDFDINGLAGATLVVVSACDQDHDSQWVEAAALVWRETTGWGVTALAPRQSRVVFMFGTGQRDCTVLHVRPAPIGSAWSVTLAVKDEASERLYVNGALVVSQENKLPRLAGAEPRAALGGTTGNAWFAGRIAEVLVYERPLLEAERKRLEQHLRAKYLAN